MIRNIINVYVCACDNLNESYRGEFSLAFFNNEESCLNIVLILDRPVLLNSLLNVLKFCGRFNFAHFPFSVSFHRKLVMLLRSKSQTIWV